MLVEWGRANRDEPREAEPRRLASSVAKLAVISCLDVCRFLAVVAPASDRRTLTKVNISPRQLANLSRPKSGLDGKAIQQPTRIRGHSIDRAGVLKVTRQGVPFVGRQESSLKAAIGGWIGLLYSGQRVEHHSSLVGEPASETLDCGQVRLNWFAVSGSGSVAC